MRMIPDYVIPGCGSEAERRFFERLKDSNANFTGLHSLTIMRHESKRQGEADFVLVGEAGLYVLEVKGGRVSREEGRWVFTDRYGSRNLKNESPFDQAMTASYSLVKATMDKLGTSVDIPQFGYGVVFPDIKFDLSSPEWEPAMVYDIRDTLKPIEAFLDRLVRLWQHRSSRPPGKISPENLKKIVQLLRGDFEAVFPMGAQIGQSEQEMVRFTNEQVLALDGMSENDRVIFKGPAGSGKTQLALEQAKRYATRGYKTLFLCYNALLASRLKQEIGKYQLQSLVQVDSVYSFFIRQIKCSPVAKEYLVECGKKSGFDEQLVCDFFGRVSGLETIEKFDAFIFDEAQDFLRQDIIFPLDSCLKSGFEKGRWSIFLDPSNQKVFLKNFEPAVYDDFIAMNSSKYTFTKNCRNSQPIALNTEVISGFKVGSPLLSTGKKVFENWFEASEDLFEKIKNQVSMLKKDGVNPNSITVLYPGKSSLEPLLKTEGRKGGFTELTKDSISNPKPNHVWYCSVQAFKGLESDVVLLADIRDLDSEFAQTVNYIGMTRAKFVLALFYHSSLQDSKIRKVTQWSSLSKVTI